MRTHHSPRGGLANCDSCAKPGSLPFVQLRFYGNIAMLIYLCAVYGRSHVTKLSSPNGDCMAHKPNLLTPEHLSWPLSSLTPPPSCPVSWRGKAPLICPRPKALLPRHFSQPCLWKADPGWKVDFYFLANGGGLVAATWSTVFEKGSSLRLASSEKRTVLPPVPGLRRGSRVLFVVYSLFLIRTLLSIPFLSPSPASFTPNFF